MKLQKLWPSSESYAEVGQSRTCTFAFALDKGDSLEIHHLPILCRDFLNDTLVWKANEDKSKNIYGYTYRGDVEEKYTSIAMWDYLGLVENLPFLNKVEEAIGVTPTSYQIVEDAVWLKSDKFWMTTSIHMSWFTTLLRILTHDADITSWEEAGKYRDSWVNDDSWAKFCKIPYVLKDLKFITVKGAGKTMTGSTMHDFNGWHSNITPGKSKLTTYGAQLDGLLAS